MGQQQNETEPMEHRLRVAEGAMEDVMDEMEKFFGGEQDPYQTLAIIAQITGKYQMASGWFSRQNLAAEGGDE